MSAITFQGIVKRFDRTIAVDHVDLDISTGEFCSLVGPSGCGKTTLLRIAAGFVEADEGTILFDGTPVASLPPNRRNLGFVFQNYALFPTKTVAQNIGFSLALRHQPKSEIAARVGELGRLMGLDDLLGRYPHELSGGQQQRVALARALANRPSILLLDEPLSALDAKIRAHLRSEIRRTVETLGITAVYVTHDQEEALSISNRIAVMNKGRLLQVGSPLDVYLHPADRFVARFIGTTNTLPCRVTAVDRIEVGGIPLMARIPAAAMGCDVATLSVRPEHVDLLPPGTGGIPGTLKGISFLGQTVRLSLATIEGRTVDADIPTVDWLGRSLAPGDVLAWAGRPGFASVFPGSPEAED